VLAVQREFDERVAAARVIVHGEQSARRLDRHDRHDQLQLQLLQLQLQLRGRLRIGASARRHVGASDRSLQGARRLEAAAVVRRPMQQGGSRILSFATQRAAGLCFVRRDHELPRLGHGRHQRPPGAVLAHAVLALDRHLVLDDVPSSFGCWYLTLSWPRTQSFGSH